MSLGNKIYTLRKEKGLSQNELAELLNVSRQAISKWETDTAVPELDKLILLCDHFGISLDELTGRTPQDREVKQPAGIVEKAAVFTHEKIVGYILLAATLVASILLFILAKDIEDFYVPLPFMLSAFACSLICLCVKSNIGYWCTWAALAPICILSCSIVGLPILLTTAIMQMIVCVVMTIIANKRLKAYAVKTSKLKSVLLIAGVILVVSGYIATLLFPVFDRIRICIVNYIAYSALALLLTYSVCYIRSIKNK